MLEECFEYSGLVGRCASCSGLIACGLHHAGRIRFDSDEDDSTDEESWTRESLGACTSAYTTLTFYHKGTCASKPAMNSICAAETAMNSSGAAKPTMNTISAA